VVFYSDADLPFDFTELNRALEVMRATGADMVTGFRHNRTSEGVRRTVYSYAYNWLVRIVFGISCKDVNFSFKLVRRQALRDMHLQADGSFIDAEMMVKALRRGLIIRQIGVDYFKRQHGQSHLSSPGTIIKILQEMSSQYPALVAIQPLPRPESTSTVRSIGAAS
jgi:hypothetical protein